MRLIDADVLKQHIDKLPALPDGNFAGNHSALKTLINMQPTIEPSTNYSEFPDSSDTISRQAAIDGKISIQRANGVEIYSDEAVPVEYLKRLPAIQPEPQWIPVSERLPRDGSWNIFTDGKNISVERYKADAIDHFFPAGRWFELEDVIAWMPLPEAYKPNNK